MISRASLLAWFALLPRVPDSEGRGIRRPHDAVDAIVTVALEVAEREPLIDARIIAAELDVIGARESGYSTHPRGLNDHGRSKGFGQTPRAETPDDLLGQVRVAAKWLVASIKRCPEFPISAYATGGYCGSVRVADSYWTLVRAELAIAVPEVSP